MHGHTNVKFYRHFFGSSRHSAG